MDIELIKKRSQYGFKGLLASYFAINAIKGYLPPFLVSVILTVVPAFLKIDIYKLLGSTNDLVISISPSLLGFNLGAYTLFIAFGSKEFLQTMVGYEKSKKRSLYQKNSSIFAVSLLVQLATLIIAFLVKFGLNLNLSTDSLFFSTIINYSSLFLVLLFSLSSLFVVKDVIVNIWNLSQMYHLALWKDKQASLRSKEAKNGIKDESKSN